MHSEWSAQHLRIMCSSFCRQFRIRYDRRDLCAGVLYRVGTESRHTSTDVEDLFKAMWVSCGQVSMVRNTSAFSRHPFLMNPSSGGNMGRFGCRRCPPDHTDWTCCPALLCGALEIPSICFAGNSVIRLEAPAAWQYTTVPQTRKQPTAQLQNSKQDKQSRATHDTSRTTKQQTTEHEIKAVATLDISLRKGEDSLQPQGYHVLLGPARMQPQLNT